MSSRSISLFPSLSCAEQIHPPLHALPLTPSKFAKATIQMSPLCSFVNNRDGNPVIHLFFLYSPFPVLSFPSVMVSLKSMHATTTKSQKKKTTIHVCMWCTIAPSP
ncbi:hypothetical protein EYC80_002994 [Monilinia laxa]|uniref:Uncharacterized protein n=1 Tax=Monilinia laxa TaxID=61186 RepID=A0A5N6KCF6_MONLA|nr:hypothetical protein EYC80_002994 [Monilinia laxa]